ncbi:Uncharacterised protein [uncultured archaeon]|nr:Uncharacterised protein [uncultured archaeon]
MEWPRPICAKCKQPIEAPAQALLQFSWKETYWHVGCYTGAVGSMLGKTGGKAGELTLAAGALGGLQGAAVTASSLRSTREKLEPELKAGRREVLQARITTTLYQGIFACVVIALGPLLLISSKDPNLAMEKLAHEPVLWLLFAPLAIVLFGIPQYLLRLKKFEDTYFKR